MLRELCVHSGITRLHGLAPRCQAAVRIHSQLQRAVGRGMEALRLFEIRIAPSSERSAAREWVAVEGAEPQCPSQSASFDADRSARLCGSAARDASVGSCALLACAAWRRLWIRMLSCIRLTIVRGGGGAGCEGAASATAGEGWNRFASGLGSNAADRSRESERQRERGEPAQSSRIRFAAIAVGLSSDRNVSACSTPALLLLSLAPAPSRGLSARR